MSLNFYANIDSFKNDSKDNTQITLKVDGAWLSKSLDELRGLKNDGVVRITVESANVYFEQNVDIETSKPVVNYRKDANGVWKKYESENINLLSEEATTKKNYKISADLVDRFLMAQQYDEPDYSDGFNLKQALASIAEGFDLDSVAERYELSTSQVLEHLNNAREEFAPYAAAWIEELNQDND